MTYLRVFALGVIFLLFCTSVLAQTQGVWYLAFCTDGDGPLGEWVRSRDEAVMAGRDHERANRGHHWEIFVQEGRSALGAPRCAAIADDPARPDTVRIVNTCGTCRIVRVSRRYQDGTVKTKEFKVKPKGQRRFLKRPNSEVVVEGETQCPDS